MPPNKQVALAATAEPESYFVRAAFPREAGCSRSVTLVKAARGRSGDAAADHGARLTRERPNGVFANRHLNLCACAPQ